VRNLKVFVLPRCGYKKGIMTISSNNLAVIRPKTNMKKSFAYSSAHLWNKLPCNIKLCASLSIFKSKCFTYLKDISNQDIKKIIINMLLHFMYETLYNIRLDLV
jgi:hypothetical protein